MKVNTIEKVINELADGTDFNFRYCEINDGKFSAYMDGDNPCGEDWEEYIEFDVPKKKAEIKEAVLSAVREVYDCFDIEDNVYMWLEAKRNGVAGVPDVLNLVRNEEYKEKALEDFIDKLEVE